MWRFVLGILVITAIAYQIYIGEDFFGKFFLFFYAVPLFLVSLVAQLVVYFKKNNNFISDFIIIIGIYGLIFTIPISTWLHVKNPLNYYDLSGSPVYNTISIAFVIFWIILFIVFPLVYYKKTKMLKK